MIATMADFIRITDLQNAIQAQRLSGLLEEQAVPHRIVTNFDSVYAGIFQTQHGWGYVEAPEEYEQIILETFDNLTDGAISDED